MTNSDKVVRMAAKSGARRRDDMPSISVIMPSYNAGDALQEAVASVLAQDYENFELIVVDDCSTDGSTAFLERHADPRVRFLRNPHNMGPAESRNIALRTATGEYAAIADADDVMVSGRLAAQARYAVEHPSVALIAGGYRRFRSSEPPGPASLPLTTHDALRIGLRYGPSFSHSTVMARRDAMLRVGGYRREFEPAEDYDMYALLLADGYVFGAVPEVVLLYRISPTGISTVGAVRAGKSHGKISVRLQTNLPLPGLVQLVRAARAEPCTPAGGPRLRYAKLLVRLGRGRDLQRGVRVALGAWTALLAVGPVTLVRLAREAGGRRRNARTGR